MYIPDDVKPDEVYPAGLKVSMAIDRGTFMLTWHDPRTDEGTQFGCEVAEVEALMAKAQDVIAHWRKGRD